MFVIWYVSDKSMMIHLNSCAYRDCGDVSYTDFIRKDESKTLTHTHICVCVCVCVCSRLNMFIT